MPYFRNTVWLFLLLTILVGCGTAVRYTSTKKSNQTNENEKESTLGGYASYYADEFHGRKTANGETFDMNALTAAHRTLPFGTKVKVKNTKNNKTVVVRINDRGPFKDNRIIDLSLAAAKQLGMVDTGTVWVELEILERSPDIK